MTGDRSGNGARPQPQVFVSYARPDAERVLQIARLLEGEGTTVWRDGDSILGGQYYGEEIVHAIAHSRVVLLICTPASLRSDNVHREMLLTWEYYHRRYIPIWLTPPTEIPERFRYCLVGCQWIDAYAQTPEHWLPQLIKALQAVGIDTKLPAGQRAGQGSEAAPKPPEPVAVDERRSLRFQPGDRPIQGVDWELEKLLGKGGFGEVWKAHNPHLPSLPPVALKFCLDLDSRSRDLLRHEADIVLRVQQQIRSDGIVPLLHAYLNNDPPCLEFPYVAGGTLVRLLDECRQSAGAFKPVQVQQMILRIARIVGAAHRATPKLIHRDLKPSNILVERRGDGKIILRVTDFGIGAVAAQPVLDRSRSSSSLQGNLSSVLTGAYSPLYASPQQMQGEKPDPRDDVYALGVIWYQLLKGDLTSPAPTGRKWIAMLRAGGMGDAAIDLLSTCFESDLADRPADAATLAEQLQELTPASAKISVSVPTVELPPIEAGVCSAPVATPPSPTPQPGGSVEPPPPASRPEIATEPPDASRHPAPPTGPGATPGPRDGSGSHTVLDQSNLAAAPSGSKPPAQEPGKTNQALDEMGTQKYPLPPAEPPGPPKVVTKPVIDKGGTTVIGTGHSSAPADPALAEFKPIQWAWMNGIGTIPYGRAKKRSFVGVQREEAEKNGFYPYSWQVTKWVIFCFLPIFPLDTYRMIQVKRKFMSSAKPDQRVVRVDRDWGQIVCHYLIGWGWYVIPAMIALVITLAGKLYTALHQVR